MLAAMSVQCVTTWLLALPVLFHSSFQAETGNVYSDNRGDSGTRSIKEKQVEGAVCTVNQELTKLKLLTILPYPDNTLSGKFRPSWDQGLNILPAMELAAEQINNRSDILPCHQLQLINVDGGCEIAPKTSLAITNNLYGQPKSQRDRDNGAIVGVIGPGCSISTLRMSAITNRPEVELVILHDAGSPLLANRTKHNNSIGILGSVYPLVKLSTALIRETKWRNVAILYDSTRPYHLITTEGFIRGLKKSNVNILFQAPIYGYFYPLLDIRDSLARIIFVFAPPQHSQRIMCLAYHWKLFYPGYQWILVGQNISGSFQDFTYHGEQYSCSYETLLNTSLRKSFMINYQMEDESAEKPLLNMSFHEFQHLYKERVNETNYKNPNTTIVPTPWAYNMYDAIWAWALVLDNLTSRYGTTLTFEYGSKTLANMILDEFYSIDFQGMSGRVSFNSSNGFINRQAILYQMVQGSEKTITSSRRMNITFPKDSYVAIPDIVRVIGLPHQALVSVFVALQCLEFLTVAALHLLTTVYRKSKSVKASSLRLSQLIFLGLYLFIIATLVLSISNTIPVTSGAVCQILWDWLFPLSFTLIAGTITVRTWRIYRIFIHYHNPGRFISTPVLVTILLFLLFVNLLTAIVRTTVDPIQQELVPFMVESGPANVLVLDRMCRSRKMNLLWIVIGEGYRALLLAITVMLTFLTRNISNKSFTTSSFAYTFSLTYLLGLTLYFLLLFITHKPNAIYGILSITFNIMICLTIVCIVLPPLLPIAREKISMLRKRQVQLLE